MPDDDIFAAFSKLTGAKNPYSSIGTSSYQGRKSLSQPELEDVLRQAGWNESVIPKMSAIGMAESSHRNSPQEADIASFNPGLNTPEKSYGIWQINMLDPARQKKYDQQRLATDPVYNAKVALDLYNERQKTGRDPLTHWGAYTDNRYKQFLGKGGSAPSAPTAPPEDPLTAAFSRFGGKKYQPNLPTIGAPQGPPTGPAPEVANPTLQTPAGIAPPIGDEPPPLVTDPRIAQMTAISEAAKAGQRYGAPVAAPQVPPVQPGTPAARVTPPVTVTSNVTPQQPVVGAGGAISAQPTFDPAAFKQANAFLKSQGKPLLTKEEFIANTAAPGSTDVTGAQLGQVQGGSEQQVADRASSVVRGPVPMKFAAKNLTDAQLNNTYIPYIVPLRKGDTIDDVEQYARRKVASEWGLTPEQAAKVVLTDRTALSKDDIAMGKMGVQVSRRLLAQMVGQDRVRNDFQGQQKSVIQQSISDPHAALLSEAATYAPKEKSSKQMEEERKQRILDQHMPILTDDQLRQKAIDNISAQRGAPGTRAADEFGAQLPEGPPTEDEIQSEMQNLKGLQPTEQGRNEAWQAAKDFSGPDWKVPKALFGETAYGVGGTMLHLAAGVLRPFSGIGIPTGYQAVSKWGDVAKMANELQSDVKVGEEPTFGFKATKALGGAVTALIPINIGGKIMQMAKLGEGAMGVFNISREAAAALETPALFGGLGALETAGAGKGVPEVAGAGASQAVTGTFFSLAHVLKNPLAQIATVGGGTAIMNAATGMPIDKNVQSMLTNVAFQIHGMLGDKSEGKSYRIWEDNKPYDIAIKKDGTVDLLKTDSKNPITGGEVVHDPTNPVYKKQAARTAKDFTNAPRQTETLQPEAIPKPEPADTGAPPPQPSPEEVAGEATPTTTAAPGATAAPAPAEELLGPKAAYDYLVSQGVDPKKAYNMAIDTPANEENLRDPAALRQAAQAAGFNITEPAPTAAAPAGQPPATAPTGAAAVPGETPAAPWEMESNQRWQQAPTPNENIAAEMAKSGPHQNIITALQDGPLTREGIAKSKAAKGLNPRSLDENLKSLWRAGIIEHGEKSKEFRLVEGKQPPTQADWIEQEIQQQEKYKNAAIRDPNSGETLTLTGQTDASGDLVAIKANGQKTSIRKTTADNWIKQEAEKRVGEPNYTPEEKKYIHDQIAKGNFRTDEYPKAHKEAAELLDLGRKPADVIDHLNKKYNAKIPPLPEGGATPAAAPTEAELKAEAAKNAKQTADALVEKHGNQGAIDELDKRIAALEKDDKPLPDRTHEHEALTRERDKLSEAERKAKPKEEESPFSGFGGTEEGGTKPKQGPTIDPNERPHKNARSLAEYVRGKGINPDLSTENPGEVQMLSNLETGTTGLVHRGKDSIGLDKMMESAWQAGYFDDADVSLRNVSDFTKAVLADLAGERVWTKRDLNIGAENLSQAIDDHYNAEYEKERVAMVEMFKDPKFNTLANDIKEQGNATDEQQAELKKYLKQYGIDPEAAGGVIAELTDAPLGTGADAQVRTAAADTNEHPADTGANAPEDEDISFDTDKLEAEIEAEKKAGAPPPTEPPTAPPAGGIPEGLTPEQHARIFDYKEEGRSDEWIARETHTTPEQVAAVEVDRPEVGPHGMLSNRFRNNLSLDTKDLGRNMPQGTKLTEGTIGKLRRVRIDILNDLAKEYPEISQLKPDANVAQAKDAVDALRQAISREMGHVGFSWPTPEEWGKWIKNHGPDLDESTRDFLEARVTEEIDHQADVAKFLKDGDVRDWFNAVKSDPEIKLTPDTKLSQLPKPEREDILAKGERFRLTETNVKRIFEDWRRRHFAANEPGSAEASQGIRESSSTATTAKEQPAKTEQPEVTTEPEKGLSRNFRAGTNDATLTFDSALQRDLYDFAANEKKGMAGGGQKSFQTRIKDLSGLKADLAKRLGVPEDQVASIAFDVHKDVRAQMKGVGHLEERTIADNVTAKKPAEPAASEETDVSHYSDRRKVWEIPLSEWITESRKPGKDQSFDTKARGEEFIEGVRRRLGDDALSDGKVKASSVLKYYDSFTTGDGNTTPNAERYAKLAYALKEGESVPPEVLKDYPDLQASVSEKPSVAEARAPVIVSKAEAEANNFDTSEIDAVPIKKFETEGSVLYFDETKAGINILNVETKPEARRQGKASDLIEQVKAYAEEKGKTIEPGAYTEEGEKFLRPKLEGTPAVAEKVTEAPKTRAEIKAEKAAAKAKEQQEGLELLGLVKGKGVTEKPIATPQAERPLPKKPPAIGRLSGPLREGKSIEIKADAHGMKAGEKWTVTDVTARETTLIKDDGSKTVFIKHKPLEAALEKGSVARLERGQEVTAEKPEFEATPGRMIEPTADFETARQQFDKLEKENPNEKLAMFRDPATRDYTVVSLTELERVANDTSETASKRKDAQQTLFDIGSDRPSFSMVDEKPATGSPEINAETQAEHEKFTNEVLDHEIKSSDTALIRQSDIHIDPQSGMVETDATGMALLNRIFKGAGLIPKTKEGLITGAHLEPHHVHALVNFFDRAATIARQGGALAEAKKLDAMSRTFERAAQMGEGDVPVGLVDEQNYPQISKGTREEERLHQAHHRLVGEGTSAKAEALATFQKAAENLRNKGSLYKLSTPAKMYKEVMDKAHRYDAEHQLGLTSDEVKELQYAYEQHLFDENVTSAQVRKAYAGISQHGEKLIERYEQRERTANAPGHLEGLEPTGKGDLSTPARGPGEVRQEGIQRGLRPPTEGERGPVETRLRQGELFARTQAESGGGQEPGSVAFAENTVVRKGLDKLDKVLAIVNPDDESTVRSFENVFNKGQQQLKKVDPGAYERVVKAVTTQAQATVEALKTGFRDPAYAENLKKQNLQDVRSALEIGGLAIPVTKGSTMPANILGKTATQMEIGGQPYYVPKWLSKELGQAFAHPYEANFLQKVVDKLDSYGMAGPLDLFFHGGNMIGSIILNTPYAGTDMISRTIGNTPATKWLTTAVNLWRTDPMEILAKNPGMLKEMADAGVIPSEYGTTTYSAKYLTGGIAKQSYGLGTLLKGPSGLDIRSRILMWEIGKHMNPKATNTEMFDFVQQLGIYEKALQSQMVNWLTTRRIGRFAVAGTTMTKNGINGWLNKSPMPTENLSFGKRTALRAQQQLGGGPVGVGAILWIGGHLLYTGLFPWQDDKSRFMQIRLKPEHRNLAVVKYIYGDKGDVYVNPAFASPLLTRGANALGISEAYNTGILGGNKTQMAESALTSIINTNIVHPIATSPTTKAAWIGATGTEPSLAGFRNQFGKPHVSPYPIKDLPEDTSFGGRAEEGALMLNPLMGSFMHSLGVNRDPKKPHEIAGSEGNILLQTLANIAAPRLILPADITKKRQAIRTQRRGMQKTWFSTDRKREAAQ